MTFRVGDEVRYLHSVPNYGSSRFNGGRGVITEIGQSKVMGHYRHKVRWDMRSERLGLNNLASTIESHLCLVETPYDPNQQDETDDDI